MTEAAARQDGKDLRIRFLLMQVRENPYRGSRAWGVMLVA
jgi:hypothetical protein